MDKNSKNSNKQKGKERTANRTEFSEEYNLDTEKMQNGNKNNSNNCKKENK